MDKKRLNRRDFLRLSALTAAGGALAACAPKEVIKTVVVEKEVPVEVVQEVEVTKVVTEEKEVEVPVEVEVTREVEVETVVEVAGPENVVVHVIVYGGVLTEADSFAEALLYTVFLQQYNLKEDRVANMVMEPWPPSREQNQKYRLMTASGELGDHIHTTYEGVTGVAKDNIALPIDDLMDVAGVSRDEWIPAAIDHVRYDKENHKRFAGPMYGLCTNALPGSCFVFSNVDVLTAAGLDLPTDDWTLLDFQAAAEAVSKPDEGIFGWSWSFEHGSGHEWRMVSPFGGEIYDPAGTEVRINSPECVEAYMWNYENRYVRRIEGTPSDQEAYGGYKSGQPSGQLIMHNSGPWGGRWWQLREENTNPEMMQSLAPTSYDGRASGTRNNSFGANWWFINANAEHPNECFDVLKYLTGTEAAIFTMESGRANPMPRVDLFDNPMVEDYPHVKGIIDALRTVVVLPVLANERDAEFFNHISQRFATVDVGEEIPDQVFMDTLAAELQDIIEQPSEG